MATGYDGDILRYWDSATQTYKEIDTSGMTFAEKYAYSPGNTKPGSENFAFYYNTDGTHVLGTRPEEWYIGGSEGDHYEGVDPNASAPPPPSDGSYVGGDLTLGGYEDPNYVPPPPVVNEPPPPVVNEPPPYDPNKPTDDWFWTDPLDYENAPQPDGDGSFVEGGPPPDTSWDWSFFRDKAPGDRQWGGYDEDYQAFERYQPGMESPWGMPNIKGGNEDFYQQQFVNALRDEQGYRARQRESQEFAQYAEDNPYENQMDSTWDWAYGGRGLPEVKMGTGQADSPSYSLASQFDNESTFGDMIRYYSSQQGFEPYKDVMSEWLERHPQEGLDSTYWSKVGDPNKIISNLGNNPEGLTTTNRDWLTQMANAAWTPGRVGPYAPVDYARPVQWGGDY